MEFLEYLGLWEETDEDWQLDPVPEGEESTETEDES